MKRVLVFAGIAIAAVSRSAAGAAGFAEEPAYAGHHIAGLPAEIRKIASSRAAACGNVAAAQHYFSVSIEGEGRQFVSLHYDKFACKNRATVCRADGCLHEIFVRSSNGWTPVFQAYAAETRLDNDGGRLCLKVRRGWRTEAYSWSRSRFLPVIDCGRE
jgi:CelD/BcsL family acetyltransferase involved in cellulose biosynthesis